MIWEQTPIAECFMLMLFNAGYFVEYVEYTPFQKEEDKRFSILCSYISCHEKCVEPLLVKASIIEYGKTLERNALLTDHSRQPTKMCVSKPLSYLCGISKQCFFCYSKFFFFFFFLVIFTQTFSPQSCGGSLK